MFNVQNGPLPIHDVVVSAVAAAVMAATITFNSTSQNRELFIVQNNFIIFQGARSMGQGARGQFVPGIQIY